MSIIVCPGIHNPTLTQSFLEGWIGQFTDHLSIVLLSQKILVFPTQNYPAYSAVHILQFLQQVNGKIQPQSGKPSSGENVFGLRGSRMPLVFISFSAGVVGAIGAAWMWQQLGGTVKAFIAFDGWGVPLSGNFPIHRLSHDQFTHWSSALLGAGADSFYADPPVNHLDLWSQPQTVQGWWIRESGGTGEWGSGRVGEREKSSSHSSLLTPHSSPTTQNSAVQKAARSSVTAAQFLTMLLERYGEL